MDTELSTTLKKLFPNVLLEIDYIDCGNGWYNLLKNLCEKIEPILVTLNKSVSSGGQPICAIQIKQKFGTLRFYMSSETPDITKYIKDAEKESAVTCEICGGHGSLTGKGWLFTRCAKHVPANK